LSTAAVVFSLNNIFSQKRQAANVSLCSARLAVYTNRYEVKSFVVKYMFTPHLNGPAAELILFGLAGSCFSQ